MPNIGKTIKFTIFSNEINTQKTKDNILHGCGLNMELDPN
jgi:hypothetical protein